MGEDELWRGQMMGEIKAVAAAVARLEKRLEKDFDELYERVRKLEIGCAVMSRDAKLFGILLGLTGGAIVSALAKLVFG